MKKVLFATTALVITAGAAAADVTLSGGARLGVVYKEGATTEWNVHNRFTLNIDGTAETDSGATMHARVRVRGGNSGNGTTSASGVSAPQVGASAGAFRMNVGNINGAFESMPGLYGGSVGLTGLGYANVVGNVDGSYWNWDSFSSTGGGANGVEMIYSGGGFGAHISYSGTTSEDIGWNGSYAFGNWTVAIGGVSSDDDTRDKIGGTVGGSFGAFGVGLAYADNNDEAKWAINGSYGFGAGTNVTAFYADEETAGDSYGIGFTYSLGGAVLAGGIVNTVADTVTADLGVRFNF